MNDRTDKPETTFKTNPAAPVAPPCPPWCTRPDLTAQDHHGEWDFIEADGFSRNHTRSFGEHVAVIGWEASVAPGVIQELRISVSLDADFKRHSVSETLQLARELLEAAQWLEEHR